MFYSIHLQITLKAPTTMTLFIIMMIMMICATSESGGSRQNGLFSRGSTAVLHPSFRVETHFISQLDHRVRGADGERHPGER